MTSVINLYGGPGTGKSTSASYLYYLAKQAGINAELVREYVKDWAWEGRSIGRFDQIYFLGKQARRESMLYGKADLIVTDSPVALSAYYAEKHCSENLAPAIHAAVRGFYAECESTGIARHFHVFLVRSKAYNPKGRFQSEDEARAMDGEIASWWPFGGNTIRDVHTDEASLKALLDEVLTMAG